MIYIANSFHAKFTTLIALLGDAIKDSDIRRSILDHSIVLARIAEAKSSRAVALNLSYCDLKEIPEEIFTLTNIKVLIITNNNIKVIPDLIVHLKNLVELYCDFNLIEKISPKIGYLEKLECISITNNRLEDLPAEIGGLFQLNRIDISDNLLPIFYDKALQGGVNQFLAFLRSLIVGTSRIYEAKLIITGEGGVGKSWCAAALRGEKPSSNPKYSSTTWGVDRTSFSVPHKQLDDVEITLNVWDFGGQQVYRITHQFFFSDQAIYLLVWNPRTGAEQCRVQEWLRTIALRTGWTSPGKHSVPRSRVIMVATHGGVAGGSHKPDYGHSDLPPDLQQMIVGSVSVDSETALNIDLLSSIISSQAGELPEVGVRFNENWLLARQDAISLGGEKPWIPFSEFVDICEKRGITDILDVQTIASAFLHRMGQAVWYGDTILGYDDDDRTLLADTLVLNPVWLTKAFVQVLEDDQTKESGGVLNHNRLAEIWTTHGRSEWAVYQPGEYVRLFRIMRRLDVALPTKSSKGTKSLVPQLVPPYCEEVPWREREYAPGPRDLGLKCTLAHNVPGVIPRIIAMTEPYHVYVDGKALCWERGVFLRDISSFSEDALITVVGDTNPIISLFISGIQPGFFADVIRRSIDEALSFWPGLDWSYSVECPTRLNRGGYCSGSFNLTTLKRRMIKGEGATVQCHECDGSFDCRDLVFGLSDLATSSSSFTVQLGYLYHREKIVCPRVFLLKRAEPRWHTMTSWSTLIGTRFELTLISELSGQKVATKEFSMTKQWVRWLSPILKVVAAAISGLALPLQGGLGDELSQASDTLLQLSSLPMEEDPRHPMVVPEKSIGSVLSVPDSDLSTFNMLLSEIGLDPRQNGMDLVLTREKQWLWMASEEVKAYTETMPKI